MFVSKRHSVRAVKETDLKEKCSCEWKINNRSVTLRVRRFEIKSRKSCECRYFLPSMIGILIIFTFFALQIDLDDIPKHTLFACLLYININHLLTQEYHYRLIYDSDIHLIISITFLLDKTILIFTI